MFSHIKGKEAEDWGFEASLGKVLGETVANDCLGSGPSAHLDARLGTVAPWSQGPGGVTRPT